jgi:superfamily II DNA or RNA helicase
MSFNLRPYQQTAIDQVREAWARVRAVLLVLPTGAGKTVVFSSIMHDHRGCAAAVVHRKEIVSQIACSLARLGVKHRVIAPPKTVALIRRKQLKLYGKSYVDPNAQCGVVSVQTMTSRSSENDTELQRWLRQVTLCVLDEGHHYVTSGLWARAVEGVSHAKLLQVTATPDRADGKGLGAHADGFAEEMIEGPSTKWLIDQGFLCRFTYKAPSTDLDVRGLAITASGDFNSKALRARVVESHIVGDVVRQYRQFADGKRAIVFASDVETAEEMAEAFRTDGVKAVSLNGKTDQGDRDRELDRFERGDLRVLVNVDLFDEGFDVPSVECVVLARPTQSLAKYLQMVGRGLRIMDGKAEAVIIDPVRNWERHGMPNWPRKWTLDGKEKGTGGKSDTIPMRVCTGTREQPGCTQPYEAYYTACPYCGTVPVPAGRSVPEQVEGDLMELDVDGMAALFEKIDAAKMSDEAYVLDMIGRNVPPKGRSTELKRHQRANYRRGVLKELVAWWVGMQPDGRELAEKHRRFFHRFGTDIGTAFTLNANDTDALIATIQRRFAEDMV